MGVRTTHATESLFQQTGILYAGSFWRHYVYAIVECGGRQYRAEEGHSFEVEKLPYEVGHRFELGNVLLIADGDNIQIGQPAVSGATVKATVVEQYRGKKIFVWKYRPKQRYRRRQGHRQSYSRLRIDEIILPGKNQEADK
jgi:large subunit ribosomal protein L21